MTVIGKRRYGEVLLSDREVCTMPTYAYRCRKCGHPFEATKTIVEHDKNPKAPCPKCQSKDVEQQPVQFQVVTSKKA